MSLKSTEMKEEMATNASVQECGVCNEEFDEDAFCPRIFQCLHSLCTNCIDQLIRKKTKHCPVCRKEFKANEAEDVMINHTMLELITLQKTNSKRVREYEDGPRKKRLSNIMEEMKKDIICRHVTCQEEQNRINKIIEDISNTEEDLKQENFRIKKDFLSKIGKVISQNNKKLKELVNTKIRLHFQIMQLKGKDKETDVVKMKVDTCTAETFKESADVIDEVEETNTAIGELIEEFKRQTSRDEKTLQTIKKEISKTKEKLNIILQDLNSLGETDNMDDPIPGTSARGANQDESLPITITTEALREMSPPVKYLLEQGKVFAVKEHEGRRRSARISITDDNRLCLHYLREEPPPSNVLIVKHGDVMRLVDPSSRITFMDLCPLRGSTLGRLYIRLNGNTKGAQQFALLCSGEMGPSYAQSDMLVVEKGCDKERVWVGDYKRNDGGGVKVLVEGLMGEDGMGEDSEEYRRPWLAGTVCGRWYLGEAKAAQFLISTRDIPGKVIPSCIGMVEEGFNVLTEAISHYPNINDVTIKDCGILLPF